MFPWKFFRWHRQGPLTWNGLNENKTKNYLQAKEFLYMDSCCFYLLHLAEDYTEIFMLKYFSVEHGVTVVTRTKPATVLWEMTSLEPLVHYQVVAKYVSNSFLKASVSKMSIWIGWICSSLFLLMAGLFFMLISCMIFLSPLSADLMMTSTQSVFTCSKLIIETEEQDVKYVQS